MVGPLDGTVVDVGVGEGLCLERLLEPGGPRATSSGSSTASTRPGSRAGLAGVSPVVADAGMLPLPDAAPTS